MPDLPKSVRARLGAEAPTEHPDADLLTAFAERGLAGAERERVLAHLAGCHDCREVLALLTPEEGPPLVASAPRRSWIYLPFVRWSAAAVAGIVVVAAVLLYRHENVVPQRRDVAAVSGTAATPSAPVDALQAQRDRPGRQKAPAEPSRAAVPPKAKPDISEKHAASSLSKDERAAGLKKQLDEDKKAGVAGGIMASTSNRVAGTPGPSAPQQSQQQGSNNEQAQRYSGSQERQYSAQAQNQAGNQQLNDAFSQGGQAVRQDSPRADQAAVAKSRGELAQAEPARPQSPRAKTAPAPGVIAGAPAQPVVNSVMWSISPQGQVLVRRIDDLPSQVVPIAPGIVFRSVATGGPDVWAGGEGGALFHSSDEGANWTRVALPTRGAIVGIEFKTRRDGVVTTAAGERYATHDTGETWSLELSDVLPSR